MEPAGISTNFMPILLVYVFSAAWAGIPDTIRPATPDREDCLAVNVTHDESPVSARYDSGRKMFQEHDLARQDSFCKAATNSRVLSRLAQVGIRLGRQPVQKRRRLRGREFRILQKFQIAIPGGFKRPVHAQKFVDHSYLRTRFAPAGNPLTANGE